MVDGLALAETTPGPLIMVLQFVGFMAGWNAPGGLTPVASAVTGALVATYATFLPCFLFIFMGAPYVEVLRHNQLVKRALGGITASVVGVVLNLGVVFGIAVVWPGGVAGGADLFAALTVAAAFGVLVSLKLDVVWIVLAGGLAGLARGALG
jgi:chromate transporter